MTITPNGMWATQGRRQVPRAITARGISAVVTLVAAGAVVLGGSIAW